MCSKTVVGKFYSINTCRIFVLMGRLVGKGLIFGSVHFYLVVPHTFLLCDTYLMAVQLTNE